MLVLLLVAISLGLPDFAAIGTTTPIFGPLPGRSLASTLSHAAHPVGVASEGAHP